MRNQDAMFYPPEQTPQEHPAEPLNIDPHGRYEPSFTEEADYEMGYGGANPYMSQMSGEKLRPRQSLQNWQWILIVVAAFFLGLLMGGFLNAIFGFIFGLLGLAVAAIFVFHFGFSRAIILPPRRFNVSERPHLIIRNYAGSVRIRRGAPGVVEVRATKYVSTLIGNSTESGLGYSQEGDIIHVSTPKSGFMSNGITYINLEIIVPAVSDVEFEGSAGSINMVGVSGQTRLKTSAGTIYIAQSSLEGQSNVTTNAGTIHVQQTQLKGTVNFETNAGTINFSGELEPRGNYQFTTNAGTIDATLPAASSFVLNAVTDLGAISNGFGCNIVGDAPHAQLGLHTNFGTITIHKRSWEKR